MNPHIKKKVFFIPLCISLVVHLSVMLLIALYAESPNRPTQQPLMFSVTGTGPALTAAHSGQSDVSPLPPVAAPASSAPGETSDDQNIVPPPAVTDDEVDTLPLGLGLTHGYVSSLADGTSLREDIRSYYFEMVGRINTEWWARAKDLNDPVRQDGIMEVFVQRDGNLAGVRIRQSTGSRNADIMLIAAVESAAPFPPFPENYTQDTFRAPLKISTPSFLFRRSRP